MMSSYHVLIPCAGSGSRMQSSAPKQYLTLDGKPILRHAIDVFEHIAEVSKVFIVVSADDAFWSHSLLDGCHKTQVLYCGGESRATTVFKGLEAMSSQVSKDDWVLVHDAARPGIDEDMVQRLMCEIGQEDIGGLLALPLADTLKRADADSHVEATISRNSLWQAQTPQMFRHEVLHHALLNSLEKQPTDEAQAMEWMGYAPKLVLGDLKNLKITYPHDLAVVSALIKAAKLNKEHNDPF